MLFRKTATGTRWTWRGSVAFPLIATGSYGFPKDEDLSIALSEIGKFLLSRDMDVTLTRSD